MLAPALALLPALNDAQTLYDQVCKKLFDAPTMRVELVMNPDREYVPYTLSFDKSGKYSIRSPRQGVVADGTQTWAWFEGSDTFKRGPMPKSPQMPFIGVGLRGFYTAADTELKATELADVVYLNRDAKRLKLEPAKANSEYDGMHWILYLGSDGLPKGYEQWSRLFPSPLQRAEYRKIELGTALDAGLFAWTPPAGFKDTTSGNGDTPPIKPTVKPEVKPTPAGNSPASVVGALLSGAGFDLAATAKRSKLTILAFWESNAATNKVDLAAVQSLHVKFAAKGLSVVLINRGSSDAALKASLTAQKITVPTLNAATAVSAASAFQVQKRPTFVLIGPDLKPRGRFSDSKALLAALAKAGFP